MITDTDSNGRTPLMQACIFGNVEAIQELLRAGAKPTYKDLWGRTALMYCTAKGDEKCMKILIDAGADIEAMDHNGKTVEEYGLSCRNFETVRRVLREEREKKISSRPRSSLPRDPSVGAQLPGHGLLSISILQLAATGEAHTVQGLLAKEHSVPVLDERDQNDRTPLILACLYGNLDIMKVLIKYGANISCRDRWGKTVLIYAASKGDYHAIKMCLEAGADPLIVDGSGKSVDEYLNSGRNSALSALLFEWKAKRLDARAKSPPRFEKHQHRPQTAPADFEAFLNSPSPSSPAPAGALPPLSPFRCDKDALEMARRGDSEGIKLALRGGLSKKAINYRDDVGRTALTLSCLFGELNSMKYLIEANADTSSKDKWGRTALMYALDRSDLEATKLLLDAGAEIDELDNSLKSVMDYAEACKCRDQAVQLLDQAKSQRMLLRPRSRQAKCKKLLRASTAPQLTQGDSPSRHNETQPQERETDDELGV